MLSSYQFDPSVAVRLPVQSDTDSKALLQLVKASDLQRSSIEQFIASGFAKAYQADVQSFMPNLLGVSRSGEWQAVLGFAVLRIIHYLSNSTCLLRLSRYLASMAWMLSVLN